MTIDRKLSELEEELIGYVETLVSDITRICDNWEQGDLAGAVHEAESTAKEAHDFVVNLHAD